MKGNTSSGRERQEGQEGEIMLERRKGGGEVKRCRPGGREIVGDCAKRRTKKEEKRENNGIEKVEFRRRVLSLKRTPNLPHSFLLVSFRDFPRLQIK